MEECLIKLTKSQFFEIFPAESRSIVISDFNGNNTVIPVGNDVVCDFCNKSLLEDDDEIAYGNYYNGYIHTIICEECRKKYYSESEIIDFDEAKEKLL